MYADTVVLPVEPRLDQNHRDLFLSHCLKAFEISQNLAESLSPSPPEVQRLREAARQHSTCPSTEDLKLIVALHVVSDLLARGWTFADAPNGRVKLTSAAERMALAKDCIRRAHLLERDAQLREPSVKEFLRRMERRRLTPKGWHSIFSVMRDGAELAAKLRPVAELPLADRAKQLPSAIAPYLQFVEPGAVCEHTGFLLTDIWRYFRHTWVTVYRSVPGRSMTLLVRDAAAPNHPVIGIAALSSSVVQQSMRDAWIGWDAAGILNLIDTVPTVATKDWLKSQLDRLIAGVYIKDLKKARLLKPGDLARPDEEVVERLRREAARSIAQHRKLPQMSLHKSAGRDAAAATDWEERALTYLFRSKRCKTLATLLGIRSVFQRHLFHKHGGRLEAAFKTPALRRSIVQLTRLIKADHVGTDMMDIAVCGAIPPYNHLLGGKLVCSLLFSPEVVRAYSKRYRNQESVIASGMAGKPVVKRPKLVLLCTTSLYGCGSSQYNRIKFAADLVGGMPGEVLQYESLGHSEGFGSFHFSRETTDAMNVLVGRSKGGRRVNSIFGEGVNPLLRKIRDALDFAGLPSQSLLRHGSPRIVYGVPLAKNFRKTLLGIREKPVYLLRQTARAEGTARLGAYWSERWLSKRIAVPGMLDQVAQHTLTFPIQHGARVPLQEEESESLFSWAAVGT